MGPKLDRSRAASAPRHDEGDAGYDLSFLAQLAADISSGVQTFNGACKLNRRADGSPRPVSATTLKAAFVRYGIPVDFTRGRPRDRVTPELRELVHRYYDEQPMGITRMIGTLQRDDVEGRFGRAVRAREVIHVYREEQLYAFQRPAKPVVTPRVRYEACQVNVIWHTDLHMYRGSGRWMIAFIDDSSRKVMGWSFLDRKRAKDAEAVLVRTMEKTGVHPFSMWTDNGGEFMADFHRRLLSHGIMHVTTKPYNPQQNGKIEKWWQVAEKCPTEARMGEFIERYNNRGHLGLPRERNSRGVQALATPNSAYQSQPQWVVGQRPFWRVGREIREFDPGPNRRNGPAGVELE